MQRSEQTFVRAATGDVVTRLSRDVLVDGVLLELPSEWQAGEVEGSRTTAATWRRGRAEGTVRLEVRPAGWGWSELELRWDGAGPRRRADPRRRDGAPTLGQLLGAHVDGRTVGTPTTPAVAPVRGRTLVAAATTIAVIAASVVIGPLVSTTPVTADDAVAQFRATSRTADATEPRTPDPDGGPDLPRPASEATADGDAGTTSPPPTGEAITPAAGHGAATGVSGEDLSAGSAGPGATPTGTTARPGRAAPVATDTSPARPPAGVYRYATDGWEELDTRGSHRRFPEETVQVIHHTDCGFRQVWEPLAERRDEHGFCSDVDPAILVTTDTARSFFGQQRRQRFTCSPVRTDRDGWTTRCDDTDGTTMTVTTRREGTERRTVGGRAVEVSRMRVEAALTGETTGRRASTVWVRASDGLLVRSEVEAELEVAGPFGRMGYRERYVLELADLEPRT
jgi:hypothetical protein